MSGPTLVQSASATGTSGTALTVTLGSPTTPGNTLICCYGGYQNTTAQQISAITLGGAADHWASANTVLNSSGFTAQDTWIDPVCAGGQTALAITLTGGSGGSPAAIAYVMEWAGLATIPLDQAPGGGNGHSTAWTSDATAQLAQLVEVAIGCVFTVGTGASPSAPGGLWTELGTVSGSGNSFLAVGYQVTSAETALTYNGSSSSAGYWASTIITLRAAPVLYPPPPVLIPPGPFSPMAFASLPPPPPPRVPSPVASTDTGTGADTATVTAALASGDTGSGTDTASAGVPAVSGDTASGADTAALTVPAQDTGGAADTAAVTAHVASQDTGTSADTASAGLLVTAADTGAGADAGSVTVRPWVLWKAPDRLSKRGDTM